MTPEQARGPRPRRRRAARPRPAAAGGCRRRRRCGEDLVRRRPRDGARGARPGRRSRFGRRLPPPACSPARSRAHRRDGLVEVVRLPRPAPPPAGPVVRRRRVAVPLPSPRPGHGCPPRRAHGRGARARRPRRRRRVRPARGAARMLGPGGVAARWPTRSGYAGWPAATAYLPMSRTPTSAATSMPSGSTATPPTRSARPTSSSTTPTRSGLPGHRAARLAHRVAPRPHGCRRVVIDRRRHRRGASTGCWAPTAEGPCSRVSRQPS